MKRIITIVILTGLGLVFPASLRADVNEALKKVSAFYQAKGYRQGDDVRSADKVESAGQQSFTLHKISLKMSRKRESTPKAQVADSLTVTVITGAKSEIDGYYRARRNEFESLKIPAARREGRLGAVREYYSDRVQRLIRDTMVFQTLSPEQWLWATIEWYSSQYETLNQQGTLDFKKTVHFGAHAELSLLTNDYLLVVEAGYLEERTGPQDMGDGAVRALNSPGDAGEFQDLARQAAQVFMGQSVAADNETVQILQVSVLPSSLDADGQAQARITVRTIEQQTGRPETARPLAGRNVSLGILAEAGVIPGKLDKTSLVTGADGTATTLFTAPKADTLKEGRIRTARIKASCEGFNPDQANITLNTYQDLSLSAEHAILPAGPDYVNTISFSFGAPGENLITASYETIVTASSGHGAFATPAQRADGQATSGKLTFNAVPQTSNSIFYHWAGPQPQDGPVVENVTVEIPKLKYRQTLTFSVGVDLTIKSARLAWQGPFFPFLLIPIQVEVSDRFHPDADMESLFKAFAINPEVHIRQTAYSAPPILDGQAGDELAQGEQLVAVASRFVERASGPSEVGATSIHDLYSSVPVKDREGRWWLMSQEIAGFTRTTEDAYPAVVPMRRGTFTYQVVLDPRFPGDASEAGHEVLLDPVEVSLLGAHEGQLGLFLMPTLKAVLSLNPAWGKTLGLAEITLKVRKGDIRGAIVDAGVMLAGETVGNWASDKMKSSYRTAIKDHYTTRIAEALGKPVEKLTARETSLALRLAKPYKLAALVELVTGWAVEQVSAEGLDSVVPGQSDIKTPNTLEKLLALLVTSAWAGQGTVTGRDPIADALEYVQLLVQGYGKETGVLVLTRQGLSSLEVRNAMGEPMTRAPKSIFAGTDPLATRFESDHVVVIPFDAGTTMTLQLEGQGKPVRLYKVLPQGTNSGILDYQGQSWKKTLLIRGDTVRPQ